jgi:hypothetical protein
MTNVACDILRRPVEVSANGEIPLIGSSETVPQFAVARRLLP